MKKLDISSVRFRAEDGDELVIRHDNRGEPYRKGLSVSLERADHRYSGHMFIFSDEAIQLRDLLNQLYPVKTKAV